MIKTYFSFVIVLFMSAIQAQCYWQQKVDYQMDIDMDVKKHQYNGKMKLIYTNHSPDVLNKVYFHLYYNAFQPESAMDYRLRNIADPDSRMTINKGTKEKPVYESKIQRLKPDQIGKHEISRIEQNGRALEFKYMGTILEVTLAEPLESNASTTFAMEWKAQIPQIIRRGGRDNKEGIDFSMAQWYPKMAEYDNEGWHLDEYIAREFYAPFGDFDVKITLPSNYIVGGSGELLNKNQMPAYSSAKIKKNTKNTWHFRAKNIHDFAWAADPDFKVDEQIVNEQLTVYYVYDKNLAEIYSKNWKSVQTDVARFFGMMGERFGKYPWSTYSIVQGGDGGMEYGTTTLITARRKLPSLRGVIFHEAAHSWFQQLFAFNETRDEWMDEGFTSYAEATMLDKLLPENERAVNPYLSAYGGYFRLALSSYEEPLSLLSDYYDLNYAYSIAAYYKGQVYLSQLGYIIGEDALKETFKQFYEQWKFKHPKADDFKKIAQDVSGINLKWYNNLWINTTRTIDYAVSDVQKKSFVLSNQSNFPMPLDVRVEFTDGTQQLYYIPTLAMRGSKKTETQFYKGIKSEMLLPWEWTQPEYSVQTSKEIKKIEIDYTGRLADVNRENNVYPREEKE